MGGGVGRQLPASSCVGTQQLSTLQYHVGCFAWRFESTVLRYTICQVSQRLQYGMSAIITCTAPVVTRSESWRERAGDEGQKIHPPAPSSVRPTPVIRLLRRQGPGWAEEPERGKGVTGSGNGPAILWFGGRVDTWVTELSLHAQTAGKDDRADCRLSRAISTVPSRAKGGFTTADDMSEREGRESGATSMI